MLKMTFTGYIGNDCKTRIDNENVAITFSVGVTKSYRNRQNQPVSKTTWIGCTIWRKTESMGRITEFLKRGKQVLVEGEPSARAYISNQDNSAKPLLDCRVTMIELLGKSDAPAPEVSAAGIENSPAPEENSTARGDNDDLPF